MTGQKIMSVLALFGSTGTLLCCALPATLAGLAGGAAVGTMLLAFPWLIPLSQHKGWIFVVAGVLITFNGILLLRPKGKLACSITGGKGCEVAGGFSKAMLWISMGIYLIGASLAYALVPVIKLLER